MQVPHVAEMTALATLELLSVPGYSLLELGSLMVKSKAVMTNSLIHYGKSLSKAWMDPGHLQLGSLRSRKSKKLETVYYGLQ